MLKSTHRPAQQTLLRQLPPEWTEHRAPTGHIYFYNATTKQSTYVRPEEQLVPATAGPVTSDLSRLVTWDLSVPTSDFALSASPHSHNPSLHSRQRDRQPHQAQDRPKTKHPIPGHAPWLLVKTKLGRRFVHNPTTNESYWKFPKDIVGGVVEFDIQEIQRRHQPDTRSSTVAPEEPLLKLAAGDETQPHESVPPVDLGEESVSQAPQVIPEEDGGSSDEYEEVEVTDSDGEEDDERIAKRQRADDSMQEFLFSEEDMVRQLAEMGETNNLDPEEYGETADDWQLGDTGVSMTDEDAKASFMDLLDDFHVNPYTDWENVVSEGYIVEDDRYTLLPNMRRRKEVFLEWSVSKIQQQKRLKENDVMQNPRIPFLALLEEHASSKLFWPEFRRKFKNEQGLKDRKMNDKEREKLYREYIRRTTKTTEMDRKHDLQTLLSSIPHSNAWNRSISAEFSAPSELLSDVRYISLKPEVRDPIIRSFIAKLPSAEGAISSLGMLMARKTQREQAVALQQRETHVPADRERHKKELARGRSRLVAEEEGLQEAMTTTKRGLFDHVRDLSTTVIE